MDICLICAVSLGWNYEEFSDQNSLLSSKRQNEASITLTGSGTVPVVWHISNLFCGFSGVFFAKINLVNQEFKNMVIVEKTKQFNYLSFSTSTHSIHNSLIFRDFS